MLISKAVNIKWSGSNKKWYEDKGYIFTKMGCKFEVKVEDLPYGSEVLVDVECDGCQKKLLGKRWDSYKKCVKEDGTYYCQKCNNRLFISKKSTKTKLKNSLSFYDWCYENLPQEEADEIIKRWDYELNKLTPKDVSYSSQGINKNGYWFKCLDYPEHKSEQKRIGNFVKGEKSINCNQCNSVSITHPHLIIFLVNVEDALKYSKGSQRKISMRCPECGYQNKKSISTLLRQGFGCNRCSDGKSYPEKFMFNILEQLNKRFITQLSKTTFKWCKNYKYDIYINNNINCIIETHGIQHYEEIKNNWGSLKEIRNNDKNKEQLAKINGIENYVILDCRQSEMEWIKNSIMQSDLPNLLNFNEDNIDWLKCHGAGCGNLIKVVCNLWNSGIKNILNIADQIKIDKTTARRYLKQGFEIGWCDYNSKEENMKSRALGHQKHNKQVICLTTNEIFDSVKEASIKYDLYNGSSISSCCKNKLKSAGKHPETNEPLIWMYYDEYINMSKPKGE